jgi:hypothetical protein
MAQRMEKHKCPGRYNKNNQINYKRFSCSTLMAINYVDYRQRPLQLLLPLLLFRPLLQFRAWEAEVQSRLPRRRRLSRTK